MKYTLDQLKTFDIAIHTPTLTEFNMMKAWLSSQGLNYKLYEEDFNDHKEETCLILFQNKNDAVGLASTSYYERRGLDVVTCEEQFFINPKPRVVCSHNMEYAGVGVS